MEKKPEWTSIPLYEIDKKTKSFKRADKTSIHPNIKLVLIIGIAIIFWGTFPGTYALFTDQAIVPMYFQAAEKFTNTNTTGQSIEIGSGELNGQIDNQSSETTMPNQGVETGTGEQNGEINDQIPETLTPDQGEEADSEDLNEETSSAKVEVVTTEENSQSNSAESNILEEPTESPASTSTEEKQSEKSDVSTPATTDVEHTQTDNISQAETANSESLYDNWYRVRKEWQDDKSQIGAFKNLDLAIKEAAIHDGYSVFDVNGNEIDVTETK